MARTREVKMLGIVKVYECLDCGEFKPECGYRKMRACKSPSPYCKPCTAARSKRYHEEQRDKARAGRRRRAQPQMPAVQVDPDQVALGRKLSCPHCGGTVVKERVNGRARCDTWLLTCVYCDDLVQLVEVAPDGSARTVPRRPLEDAPNKQDLRGDGSATHSNTSVFRPTCKVRSCGSPADEYGLCGPHLSQCRSQGRLVDAAQWAREKSPKSPKGPPKKRAKKKAPTPAAGSAPKKPAVPETPKPEISKPAPVKCQAAGCKRRGIGELSLCSTHAARWRMCGEPSVKTWLGVGAPTASLWKTMQPKRGTKSA